MKPIVLQEFEIPITFYLAEEQRDKALKLLNLHYIQDEVCNEKKDGKLVVKYPKFEKANPEFAESHRNIFHSYGATIHVELMSDGTLRIKK